MRAIISFGFVSVLALATTMPAIAGDTSAGDPGGVADTAEQRGPMPNKVTGALTASAKEINAALGQCNGRVRIIDVRDRASFERDHIPGAVNVMARDSSVTRQTKVVLASIHEDQTCLTVIYGANDRDHRAPAVAQVAAVSGYGNVHWLRGGYAEWRKGNFPVE